jgi:hypothetical protein
MINHSESRRRFLTSSISAFALLNLLPNLHLNASSLQKTEFSGKTQDSRQKDIQKLMQKYGAEFGDEAVTLTDPVKKRRV